MQPKVTTFNVQTNSGYSRDWVKAGLSLQQQSDLNEIGRTGRLNGKITTYGDYLETISTDTLLYREVPVKANNDDSTEHHLLIKVDVYIL